MMGKDDHDHSDQQAVAQGLRFRPRGWMFVVAALALTVVSVIVITGCFKARVSLDPNAGAELAEEQTGLRLFNGWPKPDLALVLSGQMYGYLQPCGCSRPQYGGLARRYNFIQGNLVRERGWPVVAVDVGDVPQRRGLQALLKYVYAMKGLQLIEYAAVGVGQNEMAMPLIGALGYYTSDPKNISPRVLAANLIDREKNFPFDILKSWELAGGKGGVPKVGIIGMVDQSVAKLVQDPDVRFEAVDKGLPGVLQQLQAQQPDLLVLLLQGSVDEAKTCARKFPQFHVILCLSEFDLAAAKPEAVVGKTLIFALGQKGRGVGVVGVYRTGRPSQPFQLRYQLVELGEEYETPEGKDAENPIHALLQNYAEELRRNNYLARSEATPHRLQVDYPEATFVGSDKCRACHKHAYEVWQRKGPEGKAHSVAYASLVEAKRPTLRQYDGECVVCHVVGFATNGGFKNETQTPFLKNVGCESCHGPGSVHIQQARDGTPDPKLLALMNPYKTPPNETPAAKRQRINRLDQSCQKCHDMDNDTHWTIDKWKLIEHNEPKE